MPYPQDDCQEPIRWPGLAGRLVEIGGVAVTYAQAAAARDTLRLAGGIMVRQVLRAAGNPLQHCDYHAAAAASGRAAFASSLPPSGRRGAAGRPVTKAAFLAALEEALRQAETREPARHFAAELAGARAAFGSDAGYAAEMAAAAVAARQAAHVTRLRTLAATAVREALAACEARSGEFSCAASSACGTGDCRLASGVMTSLRVPAGPGRLPRPGNHAHAGRGFGAGPALAALEQQVPFTVGVRVSSAAQAHVHAAVA